MKVIVLNSKLKESLSAVEKAVKENSNLPILKNILIKTFNNRLKITSTNLEVGINKFVFGKIIEEGSITIPFSTLYKIVNNSDSEKTEINTEGNNLLLKTDNYKARIQGINSDEFPIIPKINDENNFLEIDFSIFKNAIEKVVTAAQISEIRPEISGVLLDYQITILKLAATDTFRLAEKTLTESQYKGNFERGFKVIIPLKTISEVLRIFKDTERIKIYFDKSQVLFKNEDVEIISRIIDGEYPDYEVIIPKETENEIHINRNQFINAIKLVSSFSGRVNEIKLRLMENKKTLDVYSADQNLGENNYLVPIKLKGEGFSEIAFNWQYLLDGLKIIEGEKIIFGVNKDTKPSILKPIEDLSYFYILMPIKV